MRDFDAEFDQALIDLDRFITFRADSLRSVIKNAPKTYGIKGCSEIFNEGWVMGFRRCLAYMEQAANKAPGAEQRGKP